MRLNKESVVLEILDWAEKEDGDMAFKYNIIKMVEDEREEGRMEGKAEGEVIKLISQIRKKYQKGMNISDVANDLEEEVSDIQPLYNLIAKYPDEDDERILARYRTTVDGRGKSNI